MKNSVTGTISIVQPKVQQYKVSQNIQPSQVTIHNIPPSNYGSDLTSVVKIPELDDTKSGSSVHGPLYYAHRIMPKSPTTSESEDANNEDCPIEIISSSDEDDLGLSSSSIESDDTEYSDDDEYDDDEVKDLISESDTEDDKKDKTDNTKNIDSVKVTSPKTTPTAMTKKSTVKKKK